jgi:prepilin-type N-terminal cleavage/methylation domain-containing protein
MQKGFTFLEIIISLAIMGLILAVVVPPFAKSRKDKLLLQSRDDIVSLLNQARSNTLSSINNDSYGVKFETNRVTLFTGTVYDAAATTNKVLDIQNGIKIPAGGVVLNGSATSVVFNRLTGATDEYGTIVLQVGDDTTRTKVITISKTGLITSN